MSWQETDNAVALFNQRMQSTFGMTNEEYKRERARGPVSRAYLNNAADIVDRSGVVPQLVKWRADRVKSLAGRKPDIPARAVLILFLLHIQTGKGVSYHQIADTLDVQFRIEHFELLGIRDRDADHDDWYQRLWRAVDRMMKCIDPFPAPRNKKLSAAEHAELTTAATSDRGRRKAAEKMKRLDWVCEQLLHASVKKLPKDIWDKYQGNTAIDATLVQTSGRPNPADPSEDCRNADPFSGRYRREGKHDGQGAKTDLPGYELETAVMAWNRPGQNMLFPSLITAVGFHRPGELIGHGAKLIRSHERLGINNALVLCDRAYNGEQPENFHIPLRLSGWELVIDYKRTNLGLQTTYKDLILVDGNWYVTWMPQHLIDATKTYRTEIVNPDTGEISHGIDKETLTRYLAARAAYRMTPKGKADKDGYQRFTYPRPGSYMAIDRATGKRVKPTTARSITIPLDAGIAENRDETKKKIKPAIKHLQKFPYKSPEHIAYYGMRSLVESFNKTLKNKRFEDLKNVSKRSGRGFAFNYLVATLCAVSANLRKIQAFFTKVAERDSGGKLTRERRRKAASGTPLPALSPVGANAPPR